MYLQIGIYFLDQTKHQREQELQRKLAHQQLLRHAAGSAKPSIPSPSLHSAAKKLRAYFLGSVETQIAA